MCTFYLRTDRPNINSPEVYSNILGWGAVYNGTVLGVFATLRKVRKTSSNLVAVCPFACENSPPTKRIFVEVYISGFFFSKIRQENSRFITI